MTAPVVMMTLPGAFGCSCSSVSLIRDSSGSQRPHDDYRRVSQCFRTPRLAAMQSVALPETPAGRIAPG
jgi:hypothetical protein